MGTGVAVRGTSSPRASACSLGSCVLLGFGFGPRFPTKLSPTEHGDAAFTRQCSNPPAQEMSPGFQLPPAGWVAASRRAHDGARLCLPWAWGGDVAVPGSAAQTGPVAALPVVSPASAGEPHWC